MTFIVSADAYDRFMGRFSVPLSMRFVETVPLATGDRVLDVGCGPGALTGQLVERLGAEAVAAIDPSPTFVAAARARNPGVDVREGSAEALPWPDDSFDAAVAQLVVHFMADPVAGLREMARVTRRGGAVAACVWDHAGGGSPLSLFWRAVHDLDPGTHSEDALPGTREGHLAELCGMAGISDVQESSLTVNVAFSTFAEWWEPYTLGVGPAGAYVARLDDERRVALRSRCEQLLPSPPFEVAAKAWCVVARA